MNFIGSKTIETERLILRAPRMEEQKRLWEILMLPEVNRVYLTSAKKHANDESYWTWENQEKYYKIKVDHAKDDDVFTWSVFLKGEYTNSLEEEIIGQVSAQENGDDKRIRDVGWFIDPKYQGCGYASEAATAMIDYMFLEAQIERIDSGAVSDNTGSCRIFEKLGFDAKGEVIEDSPYAFLDGKVKFSKYSMDKERYLNHENSRISEKISRGR